MNKGSVFDLHIQKQNEEQRIKNQLEIEHHKMKIAQLRNSSRENSHSRSHSQFVSLENIRNSDDVYTPGFHKQQQARTR